MTQSRIPRLPLPAPLKGAETGSFTEFTVTQRMPAIARRVIIENSFHTIVNNSLEQLAATLPKGYVQPLVDDTGVDIVEWNEYQQPYLGKRWIDIPWFFAETYFYRLILNITGYFSPGEGHGIDPFAQQKRQGLETSFDSTAKICHQVNRWLDNRERETHVLEDGLASLLYFALWGNRVDLSLWSAFETDRSQFDIQSLKAHILVNHVADVINLISSNQQGRFDVVVDNAGFELVCDLCLVDFLLCSGLAKQVKLHLKPHPTFVSDAMIQDVHQTIEFFANSNHVDVSSVANRLQQYLDNEQLILSSDYFWTSPLAFWEMPSSISSDLTASNLTIIKGDANYRRLLGDRHWDYTTNISDIISYFPAPMLALRTLKSEVAAGIKLEVVEQVAQSDTNWLTNGQWGVIQLVTA
ncbi:MAG: protein-glutamate O-methyltransferase family protein [Calothrix sp. C42_A2020_038]|nr:protein-glutamate O-methyltransferase family protein [Calothrix sp. C42_A2020_038]